MSKRRKYSEEFKREAVSLTRQPGANVSQVARDIGVGSNLLFRWRRQLEGEGKSFVGLGCGKGLGVHGLEARARQGEAGAGFVARCSGVLRHSTEVKYQSIQRCRGVYPVQLMCRRLKVSTSGFYGWAKRPAPDPRGANR